MPRDRHSSTGNRRVVLLALLAACAVMLVPAPPAQAGGWSWPVDGEVLTPYRNGSDPYAAGQHRGLDIASPAGTPVRAVAAGTITFAGRLPDSGNCVTLATADGRHLVSFLHLSSIAVKRETRVHAGSTLGSVGLTGKRSIVASHLHLSVRTAAGTYIDPSPLFGPRPMAEAPVSQQQSAAKPQAAQPPAAVQRPRADSETEAQHRSQRRTAAHDRASGRTDSQRHSTNRHSRSRHTAADQVHAPSPGDKVVAAPTFAATGSAREGHASRGRVAPPPSAAANASRQRLTADAVTGDDARDAVTPDDVVTPDTVESGGTLWKLLALAIGLVAALALFLQRHRRVAGHDGEPLDGEPLDGDDRIVIERPVAKPKNQADSSAGMLRIVGR